MYLLIVFLPLLGSCLSGFFGNCLGSKGSSVISIVCLFFSCFLSILIFYEVSFFECCTYIKLNSWIDSESFNVSWGFTFDNLTAVMCSVVTFVSFLVHIYSVEYMSHDSHVSRFMSGLHLVAFFVNFKMYT